MTRPVALLCAVLALAGSACRWISPYASHPRSRDSGDSDGAPDAGPVGDGLPREAGAAQGDAWVRGWKLVPSAGPPALHGATMVYFPPRKSLLLYGGIDTYHAAQESLWELSGGTWTRVCAACAPGPRWGHVLTYDPQRQAVVLFGGAVRMNGPARGDLWTYDGAAWTVDGRVTNAPSRAESLWAYDAARRRLVIFGGYDEKQNQRDTVHELDGVTWVDPPQAAVRPSGRTTSGGNTMTYADDLASNPNLRNRVVLYSGYRWEAAKDVILDDAWTWDGATWQEQCSVCTGTPKSSAGVVYEPPSGRILIVGGFNRQIEFAGTWEWDAKGLKFTSPDPPGRDTMAIAYDRTRKAVVLFGGNGQSCPQKPGTGSWAYNCDETYASPSP